MHRNNDSCHPLKALQKDKKVKITLPHVGCIMHHPLVRIKETSFDLGKENPKVIIEF